LVARQALPDALGDGVHDLFCGLRDVLLRLRLVEQPPPPSRVV
jgi:hypothetical protein